MENGVLKRYEPKAIIGRGGNGIVWSCRDKISNQKVATKRSQSIEFLNGNTIINTNRARSHSKSTFLNY